MSILISIASYRDPELINTIKSAIDNAVYKDELFFSVVLQEFEKHEPDLSWVPGLSLIKMHPRDARGAGFARSKAISQYNGQDYYLQIDSHTRFEKNWDVLLLNEYKKAQEVASNNKIILSAFPAPFCVEGNNRVSFPTNSKDYPATPMKQIPHLNRRNEWTAKRVEFSDRSRKNPEQSSTVLAGFIFAQGSIVNEVPYDPDISFFGEEICFAMRAWTRGWDIYSPSIKILYHFYSRPNYNKIWKDRNIRKISWKEIEDKSKDKQKRVLCGLEKGIWGAGDYRHLILYEKFCGVSFKQHYGLTNGDNESTIGIREKR